MSAFRRVDFRQCGANALGILVPPGSPTFVILRPRPLDWDLLPARWNGDSTSRPQLCSLNREEAADVARCVPHALEEAAKSGISPVETLGDAAGRRFQVWVRTPTYFWLVCPRTPGKAYEPMLFHSRDDAEQVGLQIMPFVWPAADAKQEYYFNTQKFSAASQ